ncbi:aryl-alcohol oxidase [Mycena crocata]|nr:aryl-alcohol oxidase [Mycena crocata]
MFLPGFILALALSASSHARVYTSVNDLLRLRNTFDFVVVGGGTAGSVVANRLTENTEFSVLLLEAGGSNDGVLEAEVPFFSNEIGNDPRWSWNYTTTSQAGLNGRIQPYSRARILGGCSTHNGMIYTRGTRNDFDRYAEVTGDQGWSWDKLLPYFLKNEKWVPPADHHDTHGQFNPTVHSTKGMTSVSLAGYRWPAGNRVIQTTQQMPDEWPFNLDMNSGSPLGVGWTQQTIGGGERSSAATSYLTHKFQKRSNLHILLNAQVSRLLANKTRDGIVFTGVELSQDQSALSSVFARNEIILSAGAVGTPHILLNSGVGDKIGLRALGIPSLIHNPSVGKNISDQPVVNPAWFVNSSDTTEEIRYNPTRFNQAFQLWNDTNTGPFTAVGVTHIGWSRLDLNATVFDGFTDPSAGPASPHLEFMIGAGGTFNGFLPGGHYFSIVVILASPSSRGSITLDSNNPFGAPLIDLGLLTGPFDIAGLREGLKMALNFVTAPAWDGYILGLADVVLANATTDAALDAYLRSAAASAAHLVGGAVMSAENASYGVVNPDLRVKGARGLRVVDASVLPFIPAAHTQAAVYAVAERASDLIRAAWS